MPTARVGGNAFGQIQRAQSNERTTQAPLPSRLGAWGPGRCPGTVSKKDPWFEGLPLNFQCYPHSGGGSQLPTPDFFLHMAFMRLPRRSLIKFPSVTSQGHLQPYSGTSVSSVGAEASHLGRGQRSASAVGVWMAPKGFSRCLVAEEGLRFKKFPRSHHSPSCKPEASLPPSALSLLGTFIQHFSTSMGSY